MFESLLSPLAILLYIIFGFCGVVGIIMYKNA